MKPKLTAQFHSIPGEWIIKNRCFICTKEITDNARICDCESCAKKYAKYQKKRLNAEWDGTIDGEIIQPTIGMFI